MGDKIHGATVVALETEQYPDMVYLIWLTKRFPMSRDTLSRQLELLCSLPSGFLNEDFGQIISMKKVIFESNQSGNVDTLKTPGEIIKFSS